MAVGVTDDRDTPDRAELNTDRELWRAPAEPGYEAYADNVAVDPAGRIRMCRDGFCVQGTVEQWHRWFRAADLAASRQAPAPRRIVHKRVTAARAAAHEIRCRECRVTWRSWLLRLVGVHGGFTP